MKRNNFIPSDYLNPAEKEYLTKLEKLIDETDSIHKLEEYKFQVSLLYRLAIERYKQQELKDQMVSAS